MGVVVMTFAPPPVDTTREHGYLHEAIAVFERDLLIRAIEKHGWNVRNTARFLGIRRATLYNKMKRYGIRRKR